MRIPIIFITAYNSYLQEAFQVNSIQYLTKPLEYSKLEMALQKFEKVTQQSHYTNHSQLIKILQQIPQSKANYKTRLLVQHSTKYSILETSDTLYFEAEDGVIFAHTNLKRYMIKERSLQKLETMLNPLHFFRINRNLMVHSKFISSFSRFDKNTFSIKLANGKQLRTSQGRTPQFRSWILDGNLL